MGDDVVAHREWAGRMFTGILSSALCLLVVAVIIKRNKYQKNTYETLCFALSLSTLLDSLSWVICYDPSSEAYHYDDIGADVIKVSLASSFVERMNVFISNSITAYMSFTIVYTIAKGRMIPRASFWPFLVLAVLLGLFFAVYELVLRITVYNTWATADATYAWAHAERQRLLVSWSFLGHFSHFLT